MTPTQLRQLANSIKTKIGKHTLSTAESLTSGQLQDAIAHASGSSNYYHGGITAYNLQMKVKHLHVDETAAKACNCVSPQTAQEMAQGALKLFNTTIAIATTGYAEPDPDRAPQPYAYIAIAIKDPNDTNTIIERYQHDGLTRNQFRNKVTLKALQLLIKHLN